jgi:hypothetical protein
MSLLTEIYEEYKNLKRKHLKKKIQAEIYKTYASVIRFGSNVPNDNNVFPKLHDLLFRYAGMLGSPIDKITVYRNYIPKLTVGKEVYISAVGRWIAGDIIINENYYDMHEYDALKMTPGDKDKIELENVVGAIFIIIFSK